MRLVDGKGDDLLLGANPGLVSDGQQLLDFIQCQAKDGFAGNSAELKERVGEVGGKLRGNITAWQLTTQFNLGGNFEVLATDFFQHPSFSFSLAAKLSCFNI